MMLKGLSTVDDFGTLKSYLNNLIHFSYINSRGASEIKVGVPKSSSFEWLITNRSKTPCDQILKGCNVRHFEDCILRKKKDTPVMEFSDGRWAPLLHQIIKYFEHFSLRRSDFSPVMICRLYLPTVRALVDGSVPIKISGDSHMHGETNSWNSSRHSFITMLPPPPPT